MSKQLEITFLTKGNTVHLTERDEGTDEEFGEEIRLPINMEFPITAEVWVHEGMIMIYPTTLNTIKAFKEYLKAEGE